MNTILQTILAASLTGLLVLGGCATDQPASTPAPAARPSPAAAAAPADVPAPKPPLPPPAPKPLPTDAEGWQVLFNGRDLAGWKVTDFYKHGEVRVENQQVLLEKGNDMTGIVWQDAALLPKTGYEISLEAMKRGGYDFFCGLTFPVANSHCSFIVGGWGGYVVGLSSLDGMDASENETTKSMAFENNRWYRIRVRVLPDKILAWIDDDKMVDVEITDRKVAVRFGEIEYSKPLGICTWSTAAACRHIRIKAVP